MTEHIDTVKKLHTRLIDSRDGYKASFDKADDPYFKQLFERLSHQRGEFAGRIRSQLLTEGTDLDDDGSILAAAHRAFVSVRDAVGSGDEAVLAEILRGEEALLLLLVAPRPLRAALARERD